MLAQSPEFLVQLIRGITSVDNAEREQWGAVPGELCTRGHLSGRGDLHGDEAPVIAAILAWGTITETEKIQYAGGSLKVRDSFLSSLCSLTAADLVSLETLELLSSALAWENEHIAEIDGYEDLREKLGEFRAWAPDAGSFPTVDRSVELPRLIEIVRGFTAESESGWVQGARQAAERFADGRLNRHDAGVIAAVLTWFIVADAVEQSCPVRTQVLEKLSTADLMFTETLEFLSTALIDGGDSEHRGAFETTTGRLAQRRWVSTQRAREYANSLTGSDSDILSIFRGISSVFSDERAAWSAVPGYWATLGRFSPDDGHAMAGVLTWAAVMESQRQVTRERLLESLAALAAAGLARRATLEFLESHLPSENLSAAERQRYDALIVAKEQQGLQFHFLDKEGPIQLSPAGLLCLVRDTTSIDTDHRRWWSTSAGDNSSKGSLRVQDRQAIATLLVHAIVAETDLTIRAYFLQSLRLISKVEPIPPVMLRHLITALAGRELETVESEHLNALMHRGHVENDE